MKIIVEYDPTDGMITFDDGTQYYTKLNANVTEYKWSNEQIIQLASLGYSAEDLIKMKTNGII